MTQHDELVRLRHMLEHAREAIEMLGERDLAALRSDRTLELALTRLVEIIGEAAYRIPESLRSQIPDIPWVDVVGMRHRLVHGYDKVSTAVLWRTIRQNLPPLVAVAEAYLARSQR